jgi:hypothetical protein
MKVSGQFHITLLYLESEISWCPTMYYKSEDFSLNGFMALLSLTFVCLLW